MVRSVQSLCLREQMSSQGMGGFWGREELVDYRGPMGQCWSSLSAGGLPADQLVQLRWVGEGTGVFWAVQVCVGGHWSLTSWPALCSSSLCLGELLRTRVMGGFEGRVGLGDYGVQRTTSIFLRERKND